MLCAQSFETVGQGMQKREHKMPAVLFHWLTRGVQSDSEFDTTGRPDDNKVIDGHFNTNKNDVRLS